ncbi:hypothetical protein [Streptomyces sp. NPDC057280]|uniref:hypothetical protein n=1 Tax=Streptomyces sp. NPDC057280 TaxID=3346081 RepID=UPI00363BCFA7
MRPFRSTLATAGAHGFRDHPDNAEGDTDQPADFSLGSVRITLEKGSYVGRQIAFGVGRRDPLLPLVAGPARRSRFPAFTRKA